MKNMNPYILLMFLSVIIASFSQIILKKGARQKHTSLIKEYLNVYVISGYFLMVVTTVLNILAYSHGVEYKNGPIIETLGFVLVTLLSRAFFQEKITARKIVGNLLILCGVVVFYLW